MKKNTPTSLLILFYLVSLYDFTKESLYLYIYESLPKQNLFGYWLIQNLLPSYWLMLCQLLPVSGMQALKDIPKHTKYQLSFHIFH